MKAFKLIETILTNTQAPEDFKFNYRRELLRLVELLPEGATASQMSSAIKCADKLRATATDHMLFLEDAEHEYLKGRVASAKWNFAAIEIVDFVNAIEHAETIEAPHLTGADKDSKPATA